MAILVAFFCLTACGDDDDDDAGTPAPEDDDDDAAPDDDDDTDDFDHPDWPDDDTDVPDDDTSDDDIDDDVDDDADDDTDPDWPPDPNPDAKADAFRLFYRERTARTLLSYNRFGLAGDAAFGTTIGKYYIARDGDEYEIVPGPNDNNPIGMSAFTAWNLYKAIGGRDLELTLIRLFEGLVFSERVTGHDGLTVREALPGWTLVLDGVADEITRTHNGAPVTPPVTYPAPLEQEILDTFFDGVVITYREDPEEYYFSFKPINELGEYAITFVFDELPNYLRISNCCSSWMIAKQGDWTGAFWGNHNSRDNFTDYVMGYLAALDAAQTPGLPADLALAAQHAADAGRRVGDTTVANGNILMTVDEHHGYATLTPAGQVRPDGTTEWQDLGSLASCPMAYLAQALSEDGLSSPVPEIPLPGAIEHSAIAYLFDLLGIALPAPDFTCKSVDDAFFGLTWRDILRLEVFGVPWYDVADLISRIAPDLIPDLLGGMMDDFVELELGAVGLCYYAEIVGDGPLYAESRANLRNLVRMQQIFADLVYAAAANEAVAAAAGGALDAVLASADEMLYMGATYARMFDIDAPLEHFGGFDLGDQRTAWIETRKDMGNTAPWALLTDPEIESEIFTKLATKEQWIQDRYTDRFGQTVPVRRSGGGYEAIGPEDTWIPVENPRHVWFGSIRLWNEAALCAMAPETLDCAWAARGCVAADMDDGGAVNADDTTLFDTAWTLYGDGAACSPGNGYCDGADLDGSGTLDGEDRALSRGGAGMRPLRH
ncbi:MAG: hypothetical protein M5R36_03235 [Deltaproteobacteria bacterium]|nr:hypothetical protein [Deltaproteobacteria bacterium]